MHVCGGAGVDGIRRTRGETPGGKAAASRCMQARHTHGAAAFVHAPRFAAVKRFAGAVFLVRLPLFQRCQPKCFPRVCFSFGCSPGACASVSIAVCAASAAAFAHRAAAHPAAFLHCPAHMESAIQNAALLVRRRHGRTDGSFPAPPFRRASAVFYGRQHQPHSYTVFRCSASTSALPASCALYALKASIETSKKSVPLTQGLRMGKGTLPFKSIGKKKEVF